MNDNTASTPGGNSSTDHSIVTGAGMFGGGILRAIREGTRALVGGGRVPGTTTTGEPTPTPSAQSMRARRVPGQTVARTGDLSFGLRYEAVATANKCPADWVAHVIIGLPEHVTVTSASGRVGSGLAGASNQFDPADAKPHNPSSREQHGTKCHIWWGGSVTLSAEGSRCHPFFVLPPADLKLHVREAKPGMMPREFDITLKELTPVGSRVSEDVCCDHLREWEWTYVLTLPPPCTGGYQIDVQVRWFGRPPGRPPKSPGYNGSQDPPPPGLPYNQQLNPRTTADIRARDGKSGTKTYTFKEDGLPNSTEYKPVFIQLFDAALDPAPLGPGSPYQAEPGAEIGPDGMLKVEVQIPCNDTYYRQVSLQYGTPDAPADSGGGGPPPDEKKGKGRGAGGQGQDEFAEGAGEEMYGEEFAEQPYDEHAYSDFARGADAGFPYEIDQGIEQDLHRRGAAGIDPTLGVDGIQGSTGGRRPPGSRGAPWTMLDIVIDPNASQDARQAVNEHRIAGPDIVRGHFDGRFRGFIAGPM